MTDDIKSLVMKVHDFTLLKDKIIKDENYKKYLPGSHKFLRKMYVFWIVLVLFAVVLFLFRFVVDIGLPMEFIYYAMLAIFLYSLLMLLISLVLLQTRYAVPIAVTNEVKAKKIIKTNKNLEKTKEKLKERLNFEIIKNFIRKGKFDPDDISESIEFFLRTNFPQLDYIKDIFSVEILKIVETKVTNYMNEFSIEIKSELMSKVVNLQQLADSKSLNPGFIVGMVKWMVKRKIIFGMMTENELEFIPEEYLSTFAAQPEISEQVTPVPTQDATVAGDTNAEPGQSTPDTPPADDAPVTVTQDASQPQPGVTTTEDEEPPEAATGPLDDIGTVKFRIDETKKDIEKVKESYEQGNVGVDQYIHKIEVLERNLKFLKHKMDLLERIQAPETHCMYCFLYIPQPEEHVLCPNKHVFHSDCAHEYLSKFEVCPWCEEKIKKPEFI